MNASDLTPAERELLTLITRGVYASPADRARAILERLREPESLAGQDVEVGRQDPANPPLAVAAADFELHVEDGTHCPVCGRYSKIYRRPLNSSQARKLIAAYRRHGDAWFNLPDLLADLKLPGRDEAALHYFGLIEDSHDVRADGGRAGVWRVTAQGAAFARGVSRLPRYAIVRNGSVLRLEGEGVGIRDVLGAGFDLAELLA